jgi:DNA-binding NarL/FixJ family response regulator
MDQAGLRVDLIILDLDTPGKEYLASGGAGIIDRLKGSTGVLCISAQVNSHLPHWLAHPKVKGYVLKDEIDNSLAWAAFLAIEGSRVITPGVLSAATAAGLPLQKPCLILDGRQRISNLTEHQARSARLAFIYSMERKDLADELAVSEEWAYGLVSSLYEKLGLKDLLSENLEPREYLGGNPLILTYFEKIRQDFHGSGKSRDMETLAFHLLTLPDIQELA